MHKATRIGAGNTGIVPRARLCAHAAAGVVPEHPVNRVVVATGNLEPQPLREFGEREARFLF